jgi:hypothetical protein
MQFLGNGPDPARGSTTSIERQPSRAYSLRLAWAVFLAIGLPLGFMAALGPLTAAGVYIEPLRPLWQPWPPDLLKPVIGVAGFVSSLAYLCYRLGRHAGYRWGTAAAIAKARNISQDPPVTPP